MFTFDSKEPFPINIEVLIDMKVYDLVGNIKKKLIKNFILDTEYKVKNLTCEFSQVKKTHGGVRHKENIMLAVDCFKSMCMLANSETGKQVKIYYLDLEKIVKRYIMIEFQEKQLELKQEQTEKIKYQTLYNKNTKKHRFHQFKKIGPCFYVIVQGLEYKDEITRIKIGICGCRRKKI